MIAWGWRIPFVLSIVLVAVGLLVLRLTLRKLPGFPGRGEQRPASAAPVSAVFTQHGGKMLQGALIMTTTYVLFYPDDGVCAGVFQKPGGRFGYRPPHGAGHSD